MKGIKINWLSLSAKILAVAIAVLAIYMVSDLGSSSEIMKMYGALKPDTVVGFNKKLEFVETYTRMTGDLTLALDKGFTEEDAQEILDGGTIQDDTIEEDIELITDGTLLSVAQQIAQKMVTTPRSTSHVSRCDSSSSGVYCQCTGSRIDNVNINGKEGCIYRRDCSAYTMAILYFGGVMPTNTNWNSTAQNDNLECVSTNGTFRDAQVGDVLWKSGHVGIVVEIKDDKVYVADAGSTNSIIKASETGYSYCFNIDDSVKEWRNTTVKILRVG